MTGIAPSQTFDAAINGKIQGYYINANFGLYREACPVKLRGVTSIFGNTQPLYVVGWRIHGQFYASRFGLNVVTAASAGGNSSNQDNPSMRIADLKSWGYCKYWNIKGPLLPAIYGSKAAAGVIIITHQRGNSDKTNISVSQDLGFVKVKSYWEQDTLTRDIVLNQRGWNVGEYDATVHQVRYMITTKKKFTVKQNDKRNTQLSMSGEIPTRIFICLPVLNEKKASSKRTGYSNSGLRLNVDHRMSNNCLKLGISTNYINSNSDRGLSGNDNAGITLELPWLQHLLLELHPDSREIIPHNLYASSNPLEQEVRWSIMKV